MSAVPKQKYTIEEYIELLKQSEESFEYFDGEIFSMAAGKTVHGAIATNLARIVGNAIDSRPCQTYDANTAVKTVKAPPFRLPDLSVVCGEPVLEDRLGIEMLLNPILIVEILSPTTSAYDRDEKFVAYQAIDSFQEYLLVAQDRPHVTRYVRQADGQWLRADVIGLESSIRLESLDASLALSDIYRSVVFPEQPESSRRPQPPLTIA